MKPISDHAETVLARLPLPSQEINPGVRGILVQRGYAEIVSLPSPYKKHKGGNIDHYARTPKGDRLIRNGT